MNKRNKNHLIVFFVTVAAIFAMILCYGKSLVDNMTLGLDLRGGFEIVYQVSPLSGEGELPEMNAVVKSLTKRIDVLGVNEPEITIEGSDRVRIQLAGVDDLDQARKIISSTANLEFRDVNDNLLCDASILAEGGASVVYQEGAPVVSLKIKDSATFRAVTEKVAAMTNGTNLIVTWLDFEEGVDSYAKEKDSASPRYVSAASVKSAIDGDAVISGNFTPAAANELKDLINSGSLPVKMTEIYSSVVSADFGQEAFALTMRAGIVGVLLVIAFMILMYRLPGVIASIMLAVYIFAVFLIFNTMGGVFTLPGIAALVLGVGMTVDANIITFERIKDELYSGRSVQKAVKEGQTMAFSTIFDAQFTTLLAAVIMYVFGTGTVKGFATMLMVTVFATLVLNLGISRFLLSELVKSGYLDDKKTWFAVKMEHIPDLSKKQERFYEGPFKKMDFIGKAKYWIYAACAVLAVSAVCSIGNKAAGNGFMNLGIDFSSGTKITVNSTSSIDENALREEFVSWGYEPSRIQLSGDKSAYVTIKAAMTQEELTEVKADLEAIYGLEANDNVVTPVVGRELVKNAVVLTLLAWVVMLAYITIRYKWDYAVGCIVALLHDVFIVLALFLIFRLEVNIELISVILAIIGYSINNSIVVFDRIREVTNSQKTSVISPAKYKEIVNEAQHHTFIRSLYSTVTTILPVLALLLLGSNAIFTFNFAMFVGLIAGTLSSIFVAPTVWYWIRTHYTPKKKPKKKMKKEALDEMTIAGIND